MGTLALEGALVDLGEGGFGRRTVVVDGGRIAAIEEPGRSANAAERIDCGRAALLPGMVNAHTHSNESWLRGRFDVLPLEPWMVHSYPALASPRQTAREIYVRTALAALEMLRSGATCAVDFLYELAGLTEESLAAVVAAYRDVGLRAVVCLAVVDLGYLETVAVDPRLIPEPLQRRLEVERPPAWPEWETVVRRAVARFHRPDEGIAIAIAPSGPQRCSDELLQGAAALADELDLTVHIHLLETRSQAAIGRAARGCTLVERLTALDFLGPRVACEHAIWLTPGDIALAADSGATFVHNPVSNLKLGSGVCPVPELRGAGIRLALGTDGMCSNDGNDMLATLKLAGLLHTVWDLDYADWPGARAAWSMATAGGAQVAGDPDGLGAVAPGRRADLVLLDLDSAVFTPLNDPLNHVVFSSTRTAVRSVMVGGRWALRDGRVLGVDEAALLAEARELGQAVLERHAEAFALADGLVEAVRAGWREAARTDVGVERTLAARGPR
jgi:cytosine/adenosine deaminase-related metal-dependent hydrolase